MTPNKINETVDAISTFSNNDMLHGTVSLDETFNGDQNTELITEQEVPELLTPPLRRNQNRLAKSRQRKVFDINSILHVVEEKEKEKILNRAIGSQQEYFTKATMNYFSKIIKDARRSFRSKVEGAQLLFTIFGDKLDETEYQIWLVDVLKLKDRNELLCFMKYAKEDKTTFTPRGRKLLDINERESCYNFWKVNSEISVHRSNGRHLINISKENIQTQVSDLPDSELTTVETKKGTKLQAHNNNSLQGFAHFQKLYNSNISYGSFINLKPFYVSRPTEKET